MSIGLGKKKPALADFVARGSDPPAARHGADLELDRETGPAAWVRGGFGGLRRDAPGPLSSLWWGIVPIEAERRGSVSRILSPAVISPSDGHSSGHAVARVLGAA